MIKAVKVLDVSLRDGGHRINFDFTKEALTCILTAIEAAGLDYMEIGYRNGYGPMTASPGAAGLCPKDYIVFCKAFLKKTGLAVMAHPQNIDAQDLRELKDCGVQLLRICVAKGKGAEACPTIEQAKAAGLAVSVNLIHISQYTKRQLHSTVNVIHQQQPDMIYFADSNGSLFPAQTAQLYRRYTQEYAIPFGFHAHDNLGLAQANALAALEAGASYIDASLGGMGKGTGNLKTEFLIACLHAAKRDSYKLQALLQAANYVRDTLKIGHENLSMDEFVRGISDLSTAQLKQKKDSGSYSQILPD